MITTFDLTLAAISLLGYGAILGFWAGFKYGRAQAALRGAARRARVYAQVHPVLEGLGVQLGNVASHMGATNKRMEALEAQHGRQVVVDWNFLNAIAHDAGYELKRREQVH